MQFRKKLYVISEFYLCNFGIYVFKKKLNSLKTELKIGLYCSISYF